MIITLGITTFNRPEYLEKCIKAAVKQLGDVVDKFYVHNDGSDAKHKGAYKRAYKALSEGSVIQESEVNQGVAASKNALLANMLSDGADWLFLCEDDILVQSPDAITRYIEVAQSRDFTHLSFAHHGPANAGGAVERDDDIMYYPHSVGAWTMFNRECLLECGLFDENMHNAFEHVEHELRLIQAGSMPNSGAHRFPDVFGSEHWLTEIPGSIEKSSIRPRDDWRSNIRASLIYWRDNKPETYEMMFGEGMPLYGYAQGIAG